MIRTLMDKLTQRFFKGVRVDRFEEWDRRECGVILDVWNNNRNGHSDLSVIWICPEGKAYFGRPVSGVMTDVCSKTWKEIVTDPARRPPYVMYRNITTRSDALRTLRMIKRNDYQ